MRYCSSTNLHKLTIDSGTHKILIAAVPVAFCHRAHLRRLVPALEARWDTYF